MKKYNICLGGLFSMLVWFLNSCTNDREFQPELQHKQGITSIEVILPDTAFKTSRATIDRSDGWTVSNFTNGDVCGMFLTKGDLNSEDGQVWNGKEYFQIESNGSFKFSNPDILLDPLQATNALAYLYYPYSENFNRDKIDDYPGFELRKKDTDGVEKCIDYMYCNNLVLNNGAITSTFNHLFASMVIIPDEGFSNATAQDISVVLSQPYSHLELKPGYTADGLLSSISHQLTYKGGEDTDSKLRYRTWKAWEGSTYSGQRAWYVLVPPGTISYVSIKDDYGNTQNIISFNFNGNGSKTVASGNKYPVKIKLKKELDETYFPVAILDWEDDIDITDKRDAGINDIIDYNRWAAAYNTYQDNLHNLDNQVYIDNLRPYGDLLITQAGEYEWTFYVNNNLIFGSGEDALIPVNYFNDKLLGVNNYSNFHFANISQPPIKTMGPKGYVKSLNFRKIYVTSDSETPIGGIIGIMEGGTVENCNIEMGIVINNGAVGMIAGSATNAIIKNSSASGMLVGVSTYGDDSDSENYALVGEANNVTFEGNTQSLTFTNN